MAEVEALQLERRRERPSLQIYITVAPMARKLLHWLSHFLSIAPLLRRTINEPRWWMEKVQGRVKLPFLANLANKGVDRRDVRGSCGC
jgi:hypothetical protein